MLSIRCPNCRSSNTQSRMVHDRLRAAAPSGESFEIDITLPAWDCEDCHLCWQGPDAEFTKATAYENALHSRAANAPAQSQWASWAQVA